MKRSTADQDLKILVVDDFQLAQSMTKSLLRYLGFKRVDVATGGEEGLEKLRTQPVELVVCDWHMMKPIAAATFLTKVRSVPAFARLPVVVAVSTNRIKDNIDRLGLPAMACIVKPITTHGLEAAIAHALTTAQLFVS